LISKVDEGFRAADVAWYKDDAIYDKHILVLLTSTGNQGHEPWNFRWISVLPIDVKIDTKVETMDLDKYFSKVADGRANKNWEGLDYNEATNELILTYDYEPKPGVKEPVTAVIRIITADFSPK
jgi:hypothetical protein